MFREFGWQEQRSPDPQAVDTFTRSMLQWEERSMTPHAQILELYQQLIRLRHERSDMGSSYVDARWEGSLFVMDRLHTQVVCNLGEQDQCCRAPAGYQLLLLGVDQPDEGLPEIWLPPDGLVVWGRPAAAVNARATG